MVNSLTQTVLKTTAPGVPDFYQGNLTWDFSLVDPDNRRPVDYPGRQQMLAALDENTDPAELLANWRDGRIKMFVVQRLLRLRRDNPDLFKCGSYTPLVIRGRFSNSCIAFTRSFERSTMVVVVSRLTAPVGYPPIGALWQDTEVEFSGKLRDVFTGQEIDANPLRLAEAFRHLPMAVLVAEA
jgi:(1->4)-alpha-D-glucan 1-alpha-D-glucosylmutase